MSKGVLFARLAGPLAIGYGAWIVLQERGNTVYKEKFRNESSHLVKNEEKDFMVNTIWGKGSSTLSTLRDETTKKRLEAADEYYKKSYEEEKRKAAEEKKAKENT